LCSRMMRRTRLLDVLTPRTRNRAQTLRWPSPTHVEPLSTSWMRSKSSSSESMPDFGPRFSGEKGRCELQSMGRVLGRPSRSVCAVIVRAASFNPPKKRSERHLSPVERYELTQSSRSRATSRIVLPSSGPKYRLRLECLAESSSLSTLNVDHPSAPEDASSSGPGNRGKLNSPS